MIADISFKDFVNNLFEYTKVPLEKRAWLTASNDDNFTYAYTWGEIEDYVNRWLKRVPVDKLDAEIRTAYYVMGKIIDDWYLLNFNHTGGRVGYDDDYFIQRLDGEEFELHTKLREHIHKRAREIKLTEEVRQAEEEKGEPKDFKDFLLCQPDKIDALMEKLSILYKTATPKISFVIYRALEEMKYLLKLESGKEEVYQSINKRFNKKFKNQNYSYHFIEEQLKGESKYKKEIAEMRAKLEKL